MKGLMDEGLERRVEWLRHAASCLDLTLLDFVSFSHGVGTSAGLRETERDRESERHRERERQCSEGPS